MGARWHRLIGSPWRAQQRETRQGLWYSEGNLPGDTVPARLITNATLRKRGGDFRFWAECWGPRAEKRTGGVSSR